MGYKIAKKNFSLRPIVALTTISVFLFFIVCFTFAYNKIVSNILLQEEEETVLKYGAVINNAIDAEKKLMKDRAVFLADLGDAVQLAEGGRFVGDFWLLDYIDMDLLVVTNDDGMVMHMEARDNQGQYYIEPSVDFSREINEVTAQYNEQLRQGGSREGIWHVEDKAYYLCVLPIIQEDMYIGSIVLGNEYTEKRLEALAGSPAIKLYISDDSEYLKAAVNRPIISSEYVELVIPRTDIHGRPVAFVMYLDRNSYYENKSILSSVPYILTGGAALLVLVLYLIYIQLTVIPIERISAHIKNVYTPDGMSEEFRYSHAREFISLWNSVQALMGKLNESRITQDVLNHILNGLDGAIVATDVETDEVLFYNESFKRLYRHNDISPETKCYEIMAKGNEERCGFCPKDRLKENNGEVIVRNKEEDGRVYHKTDCLIEWTNKRMVHLQHAMDITQLKETEKDLQYKLQQQELISKILQNFLTGGNFNDQITDMLKLIGEFMKVTRVVLLRRFTDEADFTIENIWCGDSAFAMEIGFHKLHCQAIRQLVMGDLQEENDYTICYDSSESESFCSARECGVHSYVASRIYFDQNAWGVLCLEQCDKRRSWTSDDISFVRIMAKLLSNFFDHNKAEQDLQLMSSIVDSSPNFITYIDENGNYLYVNKSASRISGYSEVELLQQNAAFLVKDEADYVLNKAIPEVWEKKSASHILPVHCKDGRVRIYNFTSFLMSTSDRGVASIGSDITDELQVKKELEESKEAAEKSSQAKTEFLSRMSHEMRTPMNAIIGMTTIGKNSDDVWKVKDCLTKIEDASNHLLGVINDILDISKIEAGKLELYHTDFTVDDMLHKVTGVVNFKISEKHQKFKVTIDPAVPPAIISDQQHLTQVLTNLLSNAVKFTPEQGMITLGIRCREKNQADYVLEFCVTDTGIGIEKEQISRLFQAFEQADGSISRKFGGTGLGLAICKNIVEMLGGQIWVESQAGQGSAFIFTIKTQGGQAHLQAGHDKAAEESKAGYPEGCFHGYRILVAEDVPINYEIIEQLLEPTGIKMDWAQNGNQAVELFVDRAGQYDLILMDIHMPELDGYEATRRIRLMKEEKVLPYAGNIPIIAMTANVFREDIERCLAAGMDSHVGKPIELGVLLYTLRQYLPQKEG